MSVKNIGSFISEQRKKKGLTQKELAKQLSVSNKTISKWECGRGMPDSYYLRDLAEALDVKVIDILNGYIVEDNNIQKASEDIIIATFDKNKKENVIRICCTVIQIVMWGAILILITMLSNTLGIININPLILLLDIPTLMTECVLISALYFLCGISKDVFLSFLFAFKIVPINNLNSISVKNSFKKGVCINYSISGLMSLYHLGVQLSVSYLTLPEWYIMHKGIIVIPIIYASIITLVQFVIINRIVWDF